LQPGPQAAESQKFSNNDGSQLFQEKQRKKNIKGQTSVGGGLKSGAAPGDDSQHSKEQSQQPKKVPAARDSPRGSTIDAAKSGPSAAGSISSTERDGPKAQGNEALRPAGSGAGNQGGSRSRGKASTDVKVPLPIAAPA
jgi:hypothetical protein